MEIVSGKHAGRRGSVRQWANDWMTVDLNDGPQGVIVKPTMVRLDADDDEYWRLRESFLAFQQGGDRSCGQFWALWELHTDGTFTRRAPITTGRRVGR